MIYTGLRFGDGICISKRWVVNGMLHILTHKTDEIISIPLHPNLKEVLEKYDYDLSSLAISNQKFNKYVKERCLEAGINADVEVVKYAKRIKKYHVIPKYKLIASHTGRRTFITNAILAGIPLSVIQRITGHKKLVTLQKYVDIAEGINVEEMDKFSKFFGLRIGER
ncbi:tyrosine-type recombinase/integrase [Cyclobacterium plantarum]|uniref:Tyrosine-type recombinase/integrase n=1 Tax=Cyclobacterium plantarum TaxID=2716263 RepID=A0ABX0H8F3_9BACT|nr:tyrosine-type recombinase/integrase [Cyclobacterium plantarum]NHE57939.1 tyrosine-type recombinase/integrase [Cyclobacterium plantarum]